MTRDPPVAEIQRRLLRWYAEHRRELPWRGQTDPYAILVSEVMLQQTGVERVRTTYEKFLARFPTFEALAEAPRHEVLQAWAGLGYNRRAVNLHEAARIVVQQYGGRLPSEPGELRRLPGIGPYTLAALRSFVNHEDVAALDTNVRRVVGRLRFGPVAPVSQIPDAAAALVPAGQSSAWNQALMDFGSLQCTSTRPRCLICPLADVCLSAGQFDVMPAERKVAERSEPFVGSRRYYRGRLVAYLRDLAPNTLVSLPAAATAVWPYQTEYDLVWLAELARALATEGQACVVEAAGETRVGPPQ
jgi:A/G-specific adenine glycosylase